MKLIFLRLFLTYIGVLLSVPLMAQTVTTLQNLQFPDTFVSGSSQTVTVSSLDSGAAVFDVAGTPDSLITVSIVERKVDLQFGNKKIRLRDFTFGGALSDTGGSGTGLINAAGELNNIRIGASLVVKPAQAPGVYTGSMTMRLVYQ